MISSSISRYICRSMRPMLARSAPCSQEIVRSFAGKAAVAAKAGKDKKAAQTGGKKKGKKGGDEEEGYDGGGDELDHRHFDRFFFAAEEAAKAKLDWSEEEQAEHTRIAKTFTIQSFARHQRLQKDLANKIWLMSEAEAALPASLREGCEVIDQECPPSDRPWPTWSTPPIKDFDSSPYEDTNDDDDDDDEIIA